jgi:hypothetical protein
MPASIVIPVETPIPNNPHTPVSTPANVDANGKLIDFNAATASGLPPLGSVGCLSIVNNGPNTVYCALNSTISTFLTAAVSAGSVAVGPPAVYTPGVFALAANMAANFENVLINSVGLVCASGQTAAVQTQAIKSGS